MKRGNIFLLVSALFILLISSGCSEQETSKKVSLDEKGVETAGKAEAPSKETLYFGFDLRLGPKEDIKIYAPFLKYLEKATRRHFRIKFTEKYEKTLKNLGEGTTQFAAIGTLSYAIGNEMYGIKYLLSGVNQEGDPRYHAAIIAAPDSKIRDIKDLKGRSFCFGSKMSTQGHLIPRKMLEDVGITLKDLNHYYYSGSHTDTASDVLKGECDAGGIQDVLANRLSAEGKIKIIAFSEPYPSSIIAYNKSVDSDTVRAVKAALLAFEPKGRHKSLLFDWDKTEMPLGFTVLNEFEIDRVTALARKYELIKEQR
ncbi:MAG: phosphate/phosphite/phosphonate transporter, periplasmic binding protein [Nitrospirae bacterium]|nr:phosphate/phosphite/phosphonate transporter, periplasmic binding protein [Nitrospirota bacterium]